MRNEYQANAEWRDLWLAEREVIKQMRIASSLRRKAEDWHHKLWKRKCALESKRMELEKGLVEKEARKSPEDKLRSLLDRLLKEGMENERREEGKKELEGEKRS